MAMFYLTIFLLPHLMVAEVPQETCSQEEPGKLRNSQALLQVATSSIHRHSVAIQHGQLSPEESYKKTVDKCCVTDMMNFIRGEIEKDGNFFVCSEGSLAGMAVWHDCADDNSSYAGVLAGIEKGKTGKCKWIGTDRNCDKPPVEDCGGFTGTLPPCLPACSQSYLPLNFKTGDVNNRLAEAAEADRELRFSDVATHPTTGKKLDLVVLSLTPDPDSEAGKSDNGLMGDIKVKGGSKMELTFILAEKGEKSPVTPAPAELQFTFLDIDSSKTGKMTEVFYFEKDANLVMEKDAEVSMSKDPDNVIITSTEPGPGCNNPRDPMELDTNNICLDENSGQTFTTNQRLRAVMLILKDSSKFTLKLKTTCDGTCKDGRRFLFAGKSALSDLCHK